MHKSGEDYLEAVLAIEEEHGVVRTTDVANRLGLSKPSVSRAMQNLMDGGYVVRPSYGDIKLTDKGREVASRMYGRHKMLTRFFHEVLGVDGKVAEHDACLIEHDISEETFDKLSAYLHTLQSDDNV
ncbi:MAG: metal-dependent transcriptional regulator [Sphaerochaeta sp.]|jgi:Mn-dependent DtxR family transcriptional regulator|nr:metal-dependent transcriptional regulator [Sphaerochaeta sp.]MCH3919232.1 metal-dependent transcriptional regulator [Sphaerochaeta sp.]MCI2076257.1 metal-dependent transcriptional regulator [Sphaerochaeta sp.]MCI2097618.1 metal-dependent transcriptional regulator [Sphaerochaeta sp.]MCI2104985.1 metal-dependent transcriptional regulator [Sphaerochaeta sp.]